MKRWGQRVPVAGQTAVVQVNEIQVEASAAGAGAERTLGGALEGQGEEQGLGRVTPLILAIGAERL